MTSRVSFPKLLLETLRRHIAAVLITVLVFVIHIISFFLNIQNMLSTVYIEDTKNILSSIYHPGAERVDYIIEEITELSAPNLGNAVIAMFIAAFLAFDFFRYMHSKKETDFYESMPVRKQKWFFTLTTASVGLFVVLCALTTGIEIAIICGTGYGSTIILQNMLWNFVCMTGAFLACWATAVLAMTMTGHPIVAFLGFGVFSVYIPLIIGFLFPAYASKFFVTYMYQELNPNYYYFSPVTLVYKATYNWRMWNIEEHWNYLLGCFVFALIIGVIAYLLFLRRPSETAGRAMAFEKTNFMIRFLLVIPLSLYAGLFLSEMSSYASLAWHIFGIVFVAFILHGIMECIFQFDIKALISKKRQLLLSVMICLGFLFIFQMDLFQFDDYMPDAKDLKSITLDTYLFDPNSNESALDLQDGLTGEYIDDALAVIADIKDSMTLPDDEDYVYANNFIVTYELKNGVKRQRNYGYYGNDFPESLDKLYATKVMKDDHCILYHLDQTKILSMGVSNGPEDFSLDLSDAELQKFCETYLDEYTDITLTQSRQETVLFQLIVTTPADKKDGTYRSRYDVYSSFTKTLEFLEEYGAVSFNESKNINPVNMELYGSKYDKEGPKYVSDAATLQALKQHMILDDFMHEDYMGGKYTYCDLRYELNNNTAYTGVYIKSSVLDEILNQ